MYMVPEGKDLNQEPQNYTSGIAYRLSSIILRSYVARFPAYTTTLEGEYGLGLHASK